MDIVKAMNTIVQERNKYNEYCFIVKVSRRNQQVEIYLATERFDLAGFSTDLGHNLGSNICNETGVMLRRRGPHKPEFADDIVRINSLMI